MRRRTYRAATAGVIRVMCESLDYLCAERLIPALLSTAKHLAHFGEVQLSPAVEEQPGTVSRATVGRLLRRFRQDVRRLPHRGPEQANRVRQDVPVHRIPWDTDEPGHFEVYLVHHVGESAQGDYVHTLLLIDEATGWSERLLAPSVLASEGQERLVQPYAITNRRHLRRAIHEAIPHLWDLPLRGQRAA